MTTLVFPCLPENAADIVPLMAEDDRVRLGGMDIASMVHRCPVSWCVIHDGVPICVGGVMSLGAAWMVSTPELNRQKRFFLRQSATVMTAIAGRFARATTVVETCYAKSLRWVIWLGFVPLRSPEHVTICGRVAEVQFFKWSRP